MKQLIMRDIYLIRKNLLITFGIFAGLFVMGFIIALSAKCGNIAKYVSDTDSIYDILQVASYFAIIAGIVLATSLEYVPGIINKDYKNGWHQYMNSSGLRPEMVIGVRFLLIFGLFLVSIILSVGSLSLMQRVSGEALESIFHSGLGSHEGILILVYGAVVCLILDDYFILMEYIYKGRNSQKAEIIKALPIMIIIVIVMIVDGFLYANGKLEMVLEKLKGLTEHVALLYTVPILSGIMLTIICFFISVKLVKKEGRHV